MTKERVAVNARELAVLTLHACEKQGAWSELALKKGIREAGLDSRDGGLATRLCTGVLQNRMLLDFYLSHFSTVKPEKLEPKVRQILRVGLYQMCFLQRIPVSAAVNTAVELAKKLSKNPKSPSLVNGILRGVSRSLAELPMPKGTLAQRLSLMYSHPLWLVETFLDRLGEEETEALLKEHNGEPPIYAHRNPLKTDGKALLARWEEEGVEYMPHPWLSDCYTLRGTGDLERLSSFREGWFSVQDPAARLSVLAAQPKAGMRVLDICAAPGGKSFAAAQLMENRGEILSCDIHPHKETLIQKGAERLGIACIKTVVRDGKEPCPIWEDRFDLVIADVPCSGMGVIRKKPDIRYKEPEPLAGLPRVQRSILENVASFVRPGGVLLYSTCTVLPQENEGVVLDFLVKHNDFTLDDFSLPGGLRSEGGGMLTLWPHRHGTDGFFIARLKKRGVD